jgi:hypothetical protein
MRELRDRFDVANRMTAPDLWPDIETRRPGPPAQPPRAVGAIVVALLVTVVGIAIAAVALWPSADPAPAGITSPSSEPEPSFDPGAGSTVRFEFVPAEVVSSSRAELVVDAPADVARWTFETASGSVDGRPLDGSKENGGFGGGCGGDAYLSVCGPGQLFLAGRSYAVVYGRVLPVDGYRVRVTLADGRSTTITALEGLWIVVMGAADEPRGAGPDRDSVVRKVELIAPDGSITSVEDYDAQ